MGFCRIHSVQSLSHIWLFATHGLQHARLPCPSPSPGVCSISCPLSWWYYPNTFSSLSSPSSSSCNLSQHQGLFQWVSSTHQVSKVLELQLQHQSFQWKFRTDFLWDWLVWSPHSPREDSQVFSSTTVQRHQFLGDQPFFIVQLSHLYMTTGKKP